MNREEIGKLADIVIQDMRTSEALAKQKPMKPREAEEYSNDYGLAFTCQSCAERIGFRFAYCQNCGQKLDWSEE